MDLNINIEECFKHYGSLNNIKLTDEELGYIDSKEVISSMEGMTGKALCEVILSKVTGNKFKIRETKSGAIIYNKRDMIYTTENELISFLHYKFNGELKKHFREYEYCVKLLMGLTYSKEW